MNLCSELLWNRVSRMGSPCFGSSDSQRSGVGVLVTCPNCYPPNLSLPDQKSPKASGDSKSHFALSKWPRMNEHNKVVVDFLHEIYGDLWHSSSHWDKNMEGGRPGCGLYRTCLMCVKVQGLTLMLQGPQSTPRGSLVVFDCWWIRYLNN